MDAILRQCLLPTMCSSIWLVVLSRAHGLRSKDGGTRRVLPTSVGSRAAGSCPGPGVMVSLRNVHLESLVERNVFYGGDISSDGTRMA